jgi:hypothetical protein
LCSLLQAYNFKVVNYFILELEQQLYKLIF